MPRGGRLQKVLVANRGEIAKRFFLALHEENIPSVAIVTEADIGQSWYDFASEAVLIGPAANYTNIPVVVAAALLAGANAIYPGYGFLSENADFPDTIGRTQEWFDHEIIFMGPPAEVMRRVGNKLAARKLASDNNVPLFAGSGLVPDLATAREAARKIGYPVLVKLDAGGGGKGMEPVAAEEELEAAVEKSQRIGRDLYDNADFYLEKLITEPVHMEVQIFNGQAVGIRKCAVQRRNQKIIEESGRAFLDDYQYLSMLAAAERVARISGYDRGAGAGTVEFLYDAKSREFGFLEINTRLQVEYAVTDQSLRIDLVKWQIRYFDDRELPDREVNDRRFTGKEHAIECRIYAEDPATGYAPSPGRILELDLPTFNGIRCDFGFKAGDRIVPNYDPMIGKLIAYGPSRQETLIRLERALQELYIKGIQSNIPQLLEIVRHADFKDGAYTNRLLDEQPQLNTLVTKKDYNDRRSRTHIVLAALAEFVDISRRKAREFMVVGDIEAGIRQRSRLLVPTTFDVELEDETFSVEFIRITLTTFHVYVEGRYNGEIEITGSDDDDQNFLIRYGKRIMRVRVDKKSGFTNLRIKDQENKFSYYRLKVRAVGEAAREDPPGMVRSPFQGTFVKLFKTDQNGDVVIGAPVEKGEPILVLSAMKMETTLTAPVSGRIASFVEDGKIGRLVLGVTPDGKVQGRGLGEGEALFVIESEQDQSAAASRSRGRLEAEESQGERPNTFELLFFDDLEEAVRREPSRHLSSILTFLEAYFQGITPHSWIIEKLYDMTSRLSLEIYKKNITPEIENQIAGIIRQYASIKQLFSPYYETNFSAFEELSNFAAGWRDPEYRPPESFLPMLQNVFSPYGVKNFLGLNEEDARMMQEAFLAIHNSYHAVTGQSNIIQYLITILSFSGSQNSDVYESLHEVILAEQAELDTSLLELTQKTVARMFPHDTGEAVADAESTFAAGGQAEPSDSLAAEIKARPAPAGSVPDSFPLWSVQVLKSLLVALERRHGLERLYSPEKEVVIYRLENRADGAKNYVVFCLVDLDDVSFRDLMGLQRAFDRAGVAAARVLAAHQQLEKCENNRIEVLACRTPISLALTGEQTGSYSYETLQALLSGTLAYLGDAEIASILLHLDVKRRQDFAERKKIRFVKRDGKLSYELLFDTDGRSPYCIEENPADQKLFNRGKWPVDLWAAECFDPGTIEEIRIPSIDEVEWTDPKTGEPGLRPVAAKIFVGALGGARALFFMKDSRIAGGSTGNLEGLKYVAACYIGYLLNLPVYVWNDGAGANVKEGMVSLNRAGEGFLMNALLGASLPREEFRRYTEHNPDPDLRALFAELDGRFDYVERAAGRGLFVVAISFGSSAGLDVYGASQAAIQIMLNSKESYRVLTGSNVIKSVMGEDISNVDIGGARIMGKWTGIVDLIADDKFELLGTVRRIQRLFTERPALARIQRRQESAPTRLRPGQVVSETMIEENVDQGDFYPFKKDYYGAGSLVAGFARLGGRRVFLMGARGLAGIRSFAASTKACELLETARKTGTHKILIFGRHLLGEVINQDHKVVRARYDFYRNLNRPAVGLRINIVTHVDGLLASELNSGADAVIFVQTQKDGASGEVPALAAQVATFTSPNLSAAFDLARSLIDLLDVPCIPAESVRPGAGQPEVPEDTAQPFDIVTAVIQPCLDEGSFVEFFRDMNDPEKGPGLVTGLGRLNGRTLGVIADNPAIMSGAPDAPGTEKFRIFTEFLNRRDVPLLMISNSPGFVPGTKQERLRVQAIGARSLDENILGHIPVVSVVLNQNYGGRQIHAFSKYLRPGIVYLALDRAVLAVMGAQSAFDLFQGARYRSLLEAGQADEAKKLNEEFMSQFLAKSAATNDATATGILDWTIPDVRDLRSHLIRGLDTARERVRNVFCERNRS